MELLQQVCEILRSRGREATPDQVIEWCDKMRELAAKTGRPQWTNDALCKAVIERNSTATMCLHIHFGDAL